MDDNHPAGESELLAGRFEEHRERLRAVAYRMLGSLSEADDAVQEAWLRLGRTDASGIGNLGGWLTTVVGRVCLDMLRSRGARREEPLDARVPDPVLGPGYGDGADPEQHALLADSVGLALLVVLESLAPAERLAFVLHDLFGVPFDEIAPLVDRTPAAARQLASRARRRVRGTSPVAGGDPAREREVVEAFLAASRNGDFEALMAVLDPDVVVRADSGPGAPVRVLRGARDAGRGALLGGRTPEVSRIRLVNGVPGVVSWVGGRPHAVLAFTVEGGRVTAIDILLDRDRLAALGLGAPPA